MSALIRSLTGQLFRPEFATISDADLLRAHIVDRSEAAFEALVDRYGHLVWHWCRRVLGSGPDAEDAFQATFLVMSRRAASIHPNAVAGWLHAVTRRVAVRTLARRTRRQSAEAVAGQTRIACSARNTTEPTVSELMAALDEEVARLPERYRTPLLLCFWQGMTQSEAARCLGCSAGSIKGRLERGRRRLAKLLTKRGFGPQAILLAPVAIAAVPGDLLARTATLGLPNANIPSAIVALTESAVVGIGARLKLAVAAMVAVMAATGMAFGLAGLMTPADEPRPIAAPKPDESGLPAGAVKRLGASHLRIGNSAFALAPDQKSVVTVSPEGLVRTFDATTGKLLTRRSVGDRGSLNPRGQHHAELSVDGQTVLLGEDRDDGFHRVVWDVPTGREIFRLKPLAKLRFGKCVVSPDGKRLAVVAYVQGPGGTQALRVYDLPSGRMRELGPTEFNVYRLQWSSNGNRLVLDQISADGGSHHTLACFDVAAGKQLWKRPFTGQEFAFSPDGRTIAFADSRPQIGYRVLELDQQSGAPTERFFGLGTAHANVRTVIAADNRTLVASHFDGLIRVDLQTGKELGRIGQTRIGSGYGPELGAFSADGQSMVTNIGTMQRWNLATGKPMFDVPPDDGPGSPVENLAFLQDGRKLFASAWSIHSALWDVVAGNRLVAVRGRFGYQLAVTPDGLRSLGEVNNSNRNAIDLFDPVAGKLLTTLTFGDPPNVRDNGLRSYTLTADGKTLLVVHGTESLDPQVCSVTTVDIASGHRRLCVSVPGNFYFSHTPCSPCGRWVVLGGSVYQLANGKVAFAPAGAAGERLRVNARWARGPVWFSSDGRLLAGHLDKIDGDKTVPTDALGIWELATGTLLARLPHAQYLCQVAFGPDNRTIALLDGRGVRLFDLLTGKQSAMFDAPDVTCESSGFSAFAQTVAFSPDGRTLATGHRDGAIMLWAVPPSAALSHRDRESRWSELGSESPVKARTALDDLARHPAEAEALLTARFQPIAAPTDPTIAALVEKLDSKSFSEREAAMQELRKHGRAAETAIRSVRANAPSAEARKRIDGLLDELPQLPMRVPESGKTLRGVRAMEILDRLDTPGARKLLQAWAEPSKDARLTDDARGVISRRRSKDQ